MAVVEPERHHRLMRVLQVHCSYRIRAGEDSVVRAEAALLEQGGHEVVRLDPENPVAPLATVAALAQSLHNPAMVRRVRRLVAEHRPDVAHVHNTWFAASAAVHRALADCGVPVVMTVHNYRLACISSDLFRDGEICTACVGTSPWAGVRHRCYRDSTPLSLVAASEIAWNRRRRTVHDNVDVFVAPTAFLGDRLVEMGLPAERIVVKQHFVADPGQRSRPAAESRDVVFVGRLAPGKGAGALLDAWRAADTGDLRLVVVGDGPLRPDLEAAAPDGVEFVGWADHARVIDTMLGARALAFPSEWFEPFGMVLTEALGCGLPIVATDVAGVRGIADPTLLVPAGDTGALAAALGRLRDDTLVTAESTRGRARFESMFTASANLPLLEDVYHRAIDAHRPGAT